MPKPNQRSTKLRCFNALCSLALVGSLLALLFLGWHWAAASMAALALAGVVAPVAVTADSALAIMQESVLAILDGLLAIVQCITAAVSAVFS